MRPKATSRSWLVVLGIVALFIGVVVWWRWRTVPGHETMGKPLVMSGTAAEQSEKRALRQRLSKVAEALRKQGSGQTNGPLWAELRQSLSRVSSEAASAVIRSYLDSREDAPSGLGFTIGPDGFLAASPSLRVFLLDRLGQVDPAGAAVYAKAILAQMESPDEWAVCLRNLARGDSSPEARAYLQEKLDQMLRHEPWQQNPAVGFLEAFDVTVYVGGTNFIPALSGLVCQQDNPAVARAAYLALDRLVIQDAVTTLRLLQANPDLLKGREQTRVNYFARADVRDPQQKALVEEYLLDPTRTPGELNTFASLFPNANYMVSHNLLTEVQTSSGETLIARDRAALVVVETWLANPRFAVLRPQMQRLKSRLEEFARQTSAGGH